MSTTISTQSDAMANIFYINPVIKAEADRFVDTLASEAEKFEHQDEEQIMDNLKTCIALHVSRLMKERDEQLSLFINVIADASDDQSLKHLAGNIALWLKEN